MVDSIEIAVVLVDQTAASVFVQALARAAQESVGLIVASVHCPEQVQVAQEWADQTAVSAFVQAWALGRQVSAVLIVESDFVRAQGPEPLVLDFVLA